MLAKIVLLRLVGLVMPPSITSPFRTTITQFFLRIKHIPQNFFHSVEMAVELGKKVRPDMHCGICGEHGGDPVSVEFCHQIGLDYVSCSPFRVPIARLAAAQAKIKEEA